MDKSVHLKREGFRMLLRIAFSMNGGGRYRKMKLEEIVGSLASSETIRRTPVKQYYKNR